MASGQLQSFDLFKFLNPVSTAGQYQAKPYDLAVRPAEELPSRRSRTRATSPAGRCSTRARQQAVRAASSRPRSRCCRTSTARPQPRRSRCGCRCRRAPRSVSCAAANGCPGAHRHRGHVLLPVQPQHGRAGQPGGDHRRPGRRQGVDRPSTGQPIVSLTYKNGGGEEFTNITRQIGAGGRARRARRCRNAIVVDGKLVATPIVDYQPVPQRHRRPGRAARSEITGVSAAEAERIALEVQSGSLPVQVQRRSRPR